MRRFLTLRWLGLHTLAIVLVAAFLGLGYWQLHRAESGNPLSFGYSLEWPLFAGFVIFMWYKMIREELNPPAPGQDGQTDELTAVNRSGKQVVLPAAALRRAASAPPPPTAEEDAELAAYNDYLSRLNESHQPAQRAA